LRYGGKVTTVLLQIPLTIQRIRIFKIGQHLAKLQTKNIVGLF